MAVVSLWKSWPVREERHDRANGPGPARSSVGSRLRSLLSRAERLLSLKSFQHMSDAILMQSAWCAYPHARQRMHARLTPRWKVCGNREFSQCGSSGSASERYLVARLASHPTCAWRSGDETLVSPMVPLMSGENATRKPFWRERTGGMVQVFSWGASCACFTVCARVLLAGLIA